MARPRIRQFADDLGIGYGKAKSLVEEGRRRKDGGSQTLENNMSKMTEKKVAKVSKGLKKASKLHAGQAKTLDSLEFQTGGTLRAALEKLNRKEKNTAKMADIATKDTKIDVNVDKSPKDKTAKKSKHGRKKAMGGATNVGTSSQARGAGAAVRGTKFVGVR
tara:strand:+ start:151 stop:636 length:486 start_codon:yes stop_codon:yes gene_type:complete